VEAIAAAAATGPLPGLAAPSKIHISDTLAVFQHHLAEQLGLGVSAQDFANKFNLTEKSVTDLHFLKAGEELLGIPRPQWIGDGDLGGFTSQGLSKYKDGLKSGSKAVSNIYLALTRFAHPPPSPRISLQGCHKKIHTGLPAAQEDDGLNEVYVMRFVITKGKTDEFLKLARGINDR
jgi:hypothetical protein